ncbi:hypothetical protein AVEN_96690-1 [Araneus ventricosus]|uniref:Uncharacterized protein n=1 Tax=Araneus ventricosus TaxID=182803 RepID=A0A4Y2EB84_ARAVE|nr:hypothetical protein AVEN_96690-1 [Araneus ventricosus]
MTSMNILSGFRNTGIFPFNRNIFSQADFLISVVTGRSNTEGNNECGNSNDQAILEKQNEPAKDLAVSLGCNSGATTSKRKLCEDLVSSDEDTNIDERAIVCDESDVDILPIVLTRSDDFEELDKSPEQGDYVLVEFRAKKATFYIGNVIESKDYGGEFVVGFLRKSDKMVGKFVQPNVPDVTSVPEKDIKMILSQPVTLGFTKRQKSLISFEIYFRFINIK